MAGFQLCRSQNPVHGITWSSCYFLPVCVVTLVPLTLYALLDVHNVVNYGTKVQRLITANMTCSQCDSHSMNVNLNTAVELCIMYIALVNCSLYCSMHTATAAEWLAQSSDFPVCKWSSEHRNIHSTIPTSPPFRDPDLVCRPSKMHSDTNNTLKCHKVRSKQQHWVQLRKTRKFS